MGLFLAVVACGVLVGWFGRYPCHPGKLRYAFWFGAGEREARQTLDAGRAESGKIRGDAEADLGKARTAVEKVLGPVEERLLTLRGQRDTLQARAQDCGEAVGEPLGPASDPVEWLQLHEHALIPLRSVRSEEGEEGEEGEPRSEWGEPLPLEGLGVEADTYLKRHVCLRVTLPGGQNRVRQWIYPDDADADWEKRLSAFVRSVQEQIGKDNDFRARLRAEQAENADAIREAEADRQTAVEEGRRRIGAAEQHRRKEHARADGVRDDAYGEWVRDAGGLRPWW